MINFSEFMLLLEDRLDKIKELYPKLNIAHDSATAVEWSRKVPSMVGKGKSSAEHVKEFSHGLIDRISSHDPSPNKKYTQWMVHKYHNGNYRMEDLPRVNTALSNFEAHKAKLQNKDINSYKKLSEVEDAVEPHLGTHASKKQEKNYLKHQGAEEIHNDDHLAIHKLKTQEAAMHYGAGTKWCTAAKNNNMFKHYNSEGPLYVIHDKKNNRKYQLHAESDQFMNEKDDPVDKNEFRSLWKHDAVKKFEPMHQFAAEIDSDTHHELVKNPEASTKSLEHISRTGSRETVDAVWKHPKAGNNYAIARNAIDRGSSHTIHNALDRIEDGSLPLKSFHTNLVSRSIDRNDDTVAKKIIESPNLMKHVDDHASSRLVYPATKDKTGKHMNTIVDAMPKMNPGAFKGHMDTARAVAKWGTDEHRDKIIDKGYLDAARYDLAEHGNSKHRDQVFNMDAHRGIDYTQYPMSRDLAQSYLKGALNNGEHHRVAQLLNNPKQNFHPDAKELIAQKGTQEHKLKLTKEHHLQSDAINWLVQKGDEHVHHALLDHHMQSLSFWHKSAIAKKGTSEHRQKLLNSEHTNPTERLEIADIHLAKTNPMAWARNVLNPKKKSE